MAYIRYDPNKPGDFSRAYGEFLVGIIVLWGSLGSVIYYICSLVSLFKGDGSEKLLSASVFLVFMSIIDFFSVFSKVKGEAKRELAKIYFLFFAGGALDLAGIIGIIVAIVMLSQDGRGTLLLICSFLAVLLITLVVILLYRKIEGYAPIKLHANEDVLHEISSGIVSHQTPAQPTMTEAKETEQTGFDTGCIFCHKCGKKLPDDSGFCNSCGTKLK